MEAQQGWIFSDYNYLKIAIWISFLLFYKNSIIPTLPTYSSELRPGSLCKIGILNICASLKVFLQYVKIKLRTQVDNCSMYQKHSENWEIFIALTSEHAHCYFTFKLISALESSNLKYHALLRTTACIGV